LSRGHQAVANAGITVEITPEKKLKG